MNTSIQTAWIISARLKKISFVTVAIRFGDFTYLKSSDTHDKNCNISWQPKNSSSYTFMLLKLTDMTSTKKLSLWKPLQIPGLTSLPLTLTVKRSLKITFSADKIYITIFLISIRRFQICKIPKPRIRTLTKAAGNVIVYNMWLLQ